MSLKQARHRERIRWRKNLVQRRVNAAVDHLRPHRWNWSAVMRPLDRSLAQQTAGPLASNRLRDLRYFWLEGLFGAVSENFYLGFVPLFALAYGATNGQVGWLTAIANLLGAVSLFPGARLVERVGWRKPVVMWSAGGFGRLALLGLACFPFLLAQPSLAIGAIILLNGLRAFMANLGNPGWTSLVADLVPDFMRGRLLDEKDAFWVYKVCGFIIPILPLGWIFITAPWQVGLINMLGGVVWAGYNLSNFNLLLALTPDEQRPRAVALYQTAVFSSAVLGPLLGGYLADAVSYQLIFGLSFAGRLAAMTILVWFWRRANGSHLIHAE